MARSRAAAPPRRKFARTRKSCGCCSLQAEWVSADGVTGEGKEDGSAEAEEAAGGGGAADAAELASDRGASDCVAVAVGWFVSALASAEGTAGAAAACDAAPPDAAPAHATLPIPRPRPTPSGARTTRRGRIGTTTLHNATQHWRVPRRALVASHSVCRLARTSW